MSYTTDVEIVNLALAGIGEDSITATLLTTPGNNSTAKICNAIYNHERDSMITKHCWKFAKKSVMYDIDNWDDTITSTTAANPVVVTGTDISDASIEEGVPVYIWNTGVDELDGEIFVATSVNDAAQTFKLYNKDRTTTVDGSSINAATSGYVRISPLFDYVYSFKLPSDLERIYKVGYLNDVNYRREGNYIHTDDPEVYIEYIWLNTTVSKFPEPFIDCLATKLKAEFAAAIGDKPERREQYLAELEKIRLPEAYRLNAIEDLPKTNQERRDPSRLTSWQKAGR